MLLLIWLKPPNMLNSPVFIIVFLPFKIYDVELENTWPHDKNDGLLRLKASDAKSFWPKYPWSTLWTPTVVKCDDGLVKKMSRLTIIIIVLLLSNLRPKLWPGRNRCVFRTLAALADAFDEHMEVTRFCDQEHFDLVNLNSKLAGYLGDIWVKSVL